MYLSIIMFYFNGGGMVAVGKNSGIRRGENQWWGSGNFHPDPVQLEKKGSNLNIYIR